VESLAGNDGQVDGSGLEHKRTRLVSYILTQRYTRTVNRLIITKYAHKIIARGVKLQNETAYLKLDSSDIVRNMDARIESFHTYTLLNIIGFEYVIEQVNTSLLFRDIISISSFQTMWSYLANCRLKADA
jgi:hypothetical protein